MYIELNQTQYPIDNSLNGGFEPKISHLRKKNQAQIIISLYTNNDIGQENLYFFQELDELPHMLYLSNNYYWWIFENTKLDYKKINEDIVYQKLFGNFSSQSDNQRKYKISINFTYTGIYGTKDRVSFDRDFKLRKLI